MAIVDKLKDLYVKLGGSEKESASTIAEWLAKINTQMGGDNAGSPSNIEDWVDKIEDVAESGSGGGVPDSRFVEFDWITLYSNDSATFVYDADGLYFTAPFVPPEGASECPLIRLLIDGESKGIVTTSSYEYNFTLDDDYLYEWHTKRGTSAQELIQTFNLTKKDETSFSPDDTQVHSVFLEAGRVSNVGSPSSNT